MTAVQRRMTLAAGLCALVLGCHRATDTASSGAPGGPPPGPAAQGSFDTESGPFAAGKKVFVANNCFRCHTIDGVRGPMAGGPPGFGGPPPGGPPPGGRPAGGPPGAGGRPPMAGGPPGPGGWGPGKGGRRAPDLGKAGRDPAHTAEWLAAYVRDPKSQKPDSGMPPFGDKISDGDLRALAQYLASLK